MTGRIRRAVWRALDPAARARGLSLVNILLTFAILASVVSGVVETEPTISRGREALFTFLEEAFTVVFLAEYATRIWVAPEASPGVGPGRARLHWMLTPSALLDLLALAPALIFTGLTPSYLLRLFRLARILRLAKLGRFSRAWRLIGEAVSSRRHELLLTLFAGLVLLIVSATLMYLVEGPGQPEKFGSIPRALWWATITLTTIGYGDVYPESALGRLVAGVTAIMGIGLIAAPTGILAAAFSDAMQRHKEQLILGVQVEVEAPSASGERQASSL